MGKHTSTPPDIDAAIKKSSELATQFKEYTDKLNSDLQDSWKQDMGVPIPTVLEADVRSVKIFSAYSEGLNVDDFKNDAKTLVQASESHDVAQVVDKIVGVVGSAVSMAIGSVSVSAKISSDSAKVHSDDGSQTWVAALYTNAVQADSSRWGVSKQFIVVAYAFVVWQPNAKTEAGKALLARFED